MEREVNQELVKKLRNKEIWLHYGKLKAEGDLEGLRLVMKTAFPDDKITPNGTATYYRSVGNHWDGVTYESAAKITAHKLEDFFILDRVVNNYQIY